MSCTCVLVCSSNLNLFLLRKVGCMRVLLCGNILWCLSLSTFVIQFCILFVTIIIEVNIVKTNLLHLSSIPIAMEDDPPYLRGHIVTLPLNRKISLSGVIEPLHYSFQLKKTSSDLS